MAKEKDEKGVETPQEEPKKKKSKFLIIIIAVVVLLAGGAGAYFFVFSKVKEGDKKEVTKEASGVNFAFEPFVVNLMDLFN